MLRNLVSLSLLTVAIVTASSCGRTDAGGISIPKDAALVVHINTSSIAGKVSWQEIQQTNWFKELYAKETDTLNKNLLDDPAKSGIDLREDLAFFMHNKSNGNYSVFEGSILNASDFVSLNKKKYKSAGEVVKKGDINSMELESGTVVVWNDKRFIYLFDSPSTNLKRLSDPSQPYEHFFPLDSLIKFGVQLFDLEKKNSLNSDDRYTAMLKEKGDLHFWANAEKYGDNLGGLFGALKLNVLFEGNVSATTLNFDNGKIKLDSRSFYNKELKALLDKYPSGEVNTDVLNRIPSQNVAAVFALKYPPAGLKDFMKLIGVDGFVNSFLGEMGYSVDEFIKANKGDVLVAVTDFTYGEREISIPNPEGEPYTMKTTSPDAKILFATSVNDKAAFDKMIAVLKAKIPQEASGPLAKVGYQINNDWFVAGNAPEQLNAFLAGGNNKQPFASRISGKSFGGYVNLQTILTSLKPAQTDSAAIAIFDQSLKTWQDVVVTTGDKKDNSVSSQMEINLVDKNTNSLKQLNAYIDAISKLADGKNKQHDVQSN